MANQLTNWTTSMGRGTQAWEPRWYPPLRRHLWRCRQPRAFRFCFNSKGRKLGSVSFSSLLAPRSWDKPDLALAAAAESLRTASFSDGLASAERVRRAPAQTQRRLSSALETGRGPAPGSSGL